MTHFRDVTNQLHPVGTNRGTMKDNQPLGNRGMNTEVGIRWLPWSILREYTLKANRRLK